MRIEVKKIIIVFLIVILVSGGIAFGVWSTKKLRSLTNTNALPSATSGPCTVKLYRRVLTNGAYAYESSPYAEVTLNDGDIIPLNKVPNQLYPDDYTAGLMNNNGVQTVSYLYNWDFTNWYTNTDESEYFDFNNLNCSNGTTNAYAGIAVRSFSVRTCTNINGNCNTETYDAVSVMSKSQHYPYDDDYFAYNQLKPYNYVVDVNFNLGSGTLSGNLSNSNYNYIYKTARSKHNVRTYEASDITYSGHTLIDFENTYAVASKTQNKKLNVTAVYENSATVKFNKSHYPNTSSFTLDHTDVVSYSKQPDLSLLEDEEQYYFDGWYLGGSSTSDKANPNWTIQNYVDNGKTSTSNGDNILQLYGTYKPKKVVTYQYANGHEYMKVYVRPGDTIEPAPAPQMNEEIFGFWMDSDGYEFDFRTPITEDMTLTVYSIPKDRILVSFETYGGTQIPPQNILVGGKAMPPSLLPEKLGFDFDGYYKDDNFTEGFDFSAPITTTSTIYVKWNRQASFPYTMKYFVDGEQYQTDLKSPGSSRPIINYTVAQNGRTFNGWNTKEDGTGTSYSAGASYTKDEDVNLYAQWQKITYSIRYNPNNGSSSSTEYKNYNEKYTIKTSTPSKTGYDFTGWSDGNDKVYMPGDSYDKNAALVLNAQYDGKSFVVQLSTGETIQVKYGDKYDALNQIEPSKDGFEFDGWYLNSSFTGDKITSSSTVTTPNNHTLYAKWTETEPIVYTITYNFNGGVNGPANGEKHHGVNYQIPAVKPTKTGYIFTKWTTNQDGSGDDYYARGTYTKDEDVTLYAQYYYINYVITFDANGGVTSSNTYYAHYNDIYGNSYTGIGNSNGKLPVATKEGYNFVSWCRDLNDLTSCVSDNTVYDLTESITLYANYEPITYTIEYNGNGATGGSTSPSTHIYNATRPLNPNGFTKTGYNFLGWTVTPDGEGTVYANNAKVLNLTTVDGDTIELYAKWEADTRRLTFNTNGGSSVSAMTLIPGEEYGSLPVSAKSGYILAGWYLDPNFTIESRIYADKEVSLTGDATAYARWVAKQSTTFVGDINDNNNLDNEDYAMIGRFIAGTTELTDTQINIADINSDNVIDENDRELIKKALLGTYDLNICVATFETNGGSSIDNIKTNCKTKITSPENPTKNNNVFVGWYTDSNFTIPYDFNEILNINTTLYAKWQSTEIDIDSISDYYLIGRYIVIGNKVRRNQLTVDSQYSISHEIGSGKPSTNEYVGTGDLITVTNKSDSNITQTYTVVVLGDTNGDGEVNSGDLYFIQLHLLDKRILTSSYYVGANANIDDDVNSGDLYVIQRYLVGKGTLPPVIHTQ